MIFVPYFLLIYQCFWLFSILNRNLNHNVILRAGIDVPTMENTMLKWM